jgi:virginiamycin B lyase
MRSMTRSLVVLSLALPLALAAQGAAPVANNEWEVPNFGGGTARTPGIHADRPRDPYVAPDGSVFFVGQTGNYIARLDPKSGEFKKFEIDPGTNPHTLIIDPTGMVWYAGNRNAMIGRLDPATGAITRFPMSDSTVRDPHTMVFDKNGNIWFTNQQSQAVGHLDVKSGKIRYVKTGASTNPYGIVLDSKGHPWFDLFRTNKIGTIDPVTFELKTFSLPDERSRPRRIAITSDDVIWYGDFAQGRLGRLDPKTGEVTEMPMPGGPLSQPYGMATDDKDRIWVSENTPTGTRLIGYDPKTKQFFGATQVGKSSVNTIRHMHFDKKTGLLWYGTDQGTIGRAEVSKAKVAM